MTKKLNTEILVKKAEQCIIFDKFTDAEKLLRKAIKQEYLNPEAHYLLGEALCKQELFEESITELEKADALLPDNPKISQLLGWAIYMNGNPKKVVNKSFKANPWRCLNSLRSCSFRKPARG